MDFPLNSYSVGYISSSRFTDLSPGELPKFYTCQLPVETLSPSRTDSGDYHRPYTVHRTRYTVHGTRTRQIKASDVASRTLVKNHFASTTKLSPTENRIESFESWISSRIHWRRISSRSFPCYRRDDFSVQRKEFAQREEGDPISRRRDW